MLRYGLTRLQRAATQETRVTLTNDELKRNMVRLLGQGPKPGVDVATAMPPLPPPARVVEPGLHMNNSFIDFMLSRQDAFSATVSASGGCFGATLPLKGLENGTSTLFSEVDAFLSQCGAVRERLDECSSSCPGGSATSAQALSVLAMWQQAAHVLTGNLKGVTDAYRKEFPDADEAFGATDVNSSGCLDAVELRRMFKRLEVGLDDRMVRALFHATDLDKNGKIEREEFEMVLWRGRTPTTF